MGKIKRNKKGMIAAEILVGVAIFILFFISTIYTERNFNAKYQNLKLRTNASNIAVETMENILLQEYTDINSREDKEVYRDNILYKVSVDVIKYSDENRNAKDLVKTVIVNVEYKDKEEIKNFEVKTLATRM